MSKMISCCICKSRHSIRWTAYLLLLVAMVVLMLEVLLLLAVVINIDVVPGARIIENVVDDSDCLPCCNFDADLFLSFFLPFFHLFFSISFFFRLFCFIVRKKLSLSLSFFLFFACSF
jgi:hypothetical protein